MKKVLIICLLFALCALSACAPAPAPTPASPAAAPVEAPAAPVEAPAPVEASAAPAEAPTEVETSAPAAASAPAIAEVVMRDAELSPITTEGVTTSMFSVTVPHVSIPGNETASMRINDEYAEELLEVEKDAKEIAGMAGEDYMQSDADRKADFPVYFLDVSYTVGRNDGKVLSMVEDILQFTGGAHPNGAREAKTFLSATGKELELEDIFADEAAGRAQINDALLAQLAASDIDFFEGYEADVPDILDDDTWYFSDTGLVVIVNEYIIGPHAVGINEFTIPYAALTELKTEFLPA